MYKFLMVDDEEIVRRGFANKIDWNRLGFEFLEPCCNGREAIEAIRTLHPDVVMTDIYMPHMDGLAVAAYAAENHPDIIVVVLSGYDEFEYAQKAIRTNVFDYILKPVTSRDLSNLAVKLKAKLDADRRRREDADILKERASLGEDLLKVKSLLELVSGGQGISENKFSDLFGFSPKNLACCGVVIERVPSSSEPEAISPPGMPDGETGAVRRFLVFRPKEYREAVLVFEKDVNVCDRRARTVAEQAVLEPGTTVGIGRTYASWLDASRTYDEAAAALTYRLIDEGGSVFRYFQSREDDPSTVAGLRSLCDRICRSVLSGDGPATEEHAAAFFSSLKDTRMSPQRIRYEIDNLFTTILDDFNGLGVASTVVERELGGDYYRTVENLKTREEVLMFLRRLGTFAASILAARNLPLPEWKVLDFKEYLARHFSEEGITIQKVADNLGISSSYLSKLVKRYLHKSFVDYLTEIRIESARDLLKTTDLVAYEIAGMCGYPDAHYFSSIFKKHTGTTPSEFRNRHRGTIGEP